MSKQHKIRWRESDLKELNRVVKNFNSKLARLEKKNPENIRFLPKFAKSIMDDDTKEEMIVFTNRLSVNQLKELINTRQDLKREINALKRFSRRGAEEITQITKGYDENGNIVNLDNNIQVTKWQKAEMNRRISRINKQREERLEQLKATELKRHGKSLGYTLGDIGMGNQSKLELEPLRPFFKSMSQKDVSWKYRTIMKESQLEYFNVRDEALRDNYIWSLVTNFNPHDIDDVISDIQNMDIKDFLAKFYEQGGNFEMSYPDEEQYQAYLDELKNIWSDIDIERDKLSPPNKTNIKKGNTSNSANVSENSVSVGLKDGMYALFDYKGETIGKFANETLMNDYIKKHKYKKL